MIPSIGLAPGRIKQEPLPGYRVTCCRVPKPHLHYIGCIDPPSLESN